MLKMENDFRQSLFQNKYKCLLHIQEYDLMLSMQNDLKVVKRNKNS